MVDFVTLQRPRLTRNEIEQKAHSILAELGLLAMPVNPASVADRLGIAVNAAVFERPGIHGMAFKKDSKTQIYVNANDPPYRRRFTIAHELGHALLQLGEAKEGKFVDTDAEYLFRTTDQNGYSPEEIEANQFAAALLMDEGLVREAAKETLDVEELARKFSVSPEAMGIRLKNLGLLNNRVVA